MFSFSDIPWIFFMLPELMCIIPFPSSYHLWANSSWCLRIQVYIIFSTKAYLAAGAWTLSPSTCSHLVSWTFLKGSHCTLLGLWAYLSVFPSTPAVPNLLGTREWFCGRKFLGPGVGWGWLWFPPLAHLLLCGPVSNRPLTGWYWSVALGGYPCSRMQRH